MRNRSNEEWLEELSNEDINEAVTDLRAILIRGLTFALMNRVKPRDLSPLVEDFTQDALLKILANIHTFRGESKFTTWAQKIAVRVAFTELRRLRWKDISIEDLLPEDGGDFVPAILSDPSPDPEKRTTQILLAEIVERVIKEELTDRQRNAMLAIMVGQMPLSEVAERLGTNRNALYKLMHDARKRLQNRLLDEGLSTSEILAAFE